MAIDLATQYLEEARRQMRGHKRMGEGAMAQLSDDELFLTLDPESNSVGILVKHLVGNMRSRFTDFLTSDGEKPDRFRDREFEVTGATTREDVMKWWEEGWACVFGTIDALSQGLGIVAGNHSSRLTRASDIESHFDELVVSSGGRAAPVGVVGEQPERAVRTRHGIPQEARRLSAGLHSPEVGVGPGQGDQLGMRAALDDAPLV